MPTYLYGFGYEQKGEMDYNRRTGADFESSTGVFIEALSEAEALEWGREISEAFVRYEHGDPSVSWRALGYAHWIEPNPETSSWKHCLAFFPKVKAGQFPDFPRMTAKAYHDWSKANGSDDAGTSDASRT